MSQDRQEQLLDLLSTKAVYGLSDDEQAQLDELSDVTTDDEYLWIETTAAAINMAALSDEEPMPAHLYSKIVADADQFFATEPTPALKKTPVRTEQRAIFETQPESNGVSWFSWLGWAAAAAACIALAFNVWFKAPQTEVAINPPPPANTPLPLTPAQLREQMMSSTAALVKANWGAGNVKELKQVTGDIVWSDEKQTGYMRFRGLPVNNAQKETYQLWIFDKNQDVETPIDGGTFDVTSEGEVIIPINAKLKAQDPTMFAITIEKPGGVVVSKRQKVAALAPVETATS